MGSKGVLCAGRSRCWAWPGAGLFTALLSGPKSPPYPAHSSPCAISPQRHGPSSLTTPFPPLCTPGGAIQLGVGADGDRGLHSRPPVPLGAHHTPGSRAAGGGRRGCPRGGRGGAWSHQRRRRADHPAHQAEASWRRGRCVPVGTAVREWGPMIPCRPAPRQTHRLCTLVDSVGPHRHAHPTLPPSRRWRRAGRGGAGAAPVTGSHGPRQPVTHVHRLGSMVVGMPLADRPSQKRSRCNSAVENVEMPARLSRARAAAHLSAMSTLKSLKAQGILAVNHLQAL